MGQTHHEIRQNLAERLCWEVARRDDAWVARRLYCKQLSASLPSKLGSDAALMPLVGCKAQQIRQGIC
jgi:hypothetical protein